MIKREFNYGELYKALALEPEATKTILRVFLYLFANYFKKNEDDLGLGIPTEHGYISTAKIISERLNISLDEYIKAKEFITSHQLLICQEIDDREIWIIGNNKRWFLKTLGANLIDAKKIEIPKITLGKGAYDKLFKNDL